MPFFEKKSRHHFRSKSPGSQEHTSRTTRLFGATKTLRDFGLKNNQMLSRFCAFDTADKNNGILKESLSTTMHCEREYSLRPFCWPVNSFE